MRSLSTSPVLNVHYYNSICIRSVCDYPFVSPFHSIFVDHSTVLEDLPYPNFVRVHPQKFTTHPVLDNDAARSGYFHQDHHKTVSVLAGYCAGRSMLTVICLMFVLTDDFKR